MERLINGSDLRCLILCIFILAQSTCAQKDFVSVACCAEFNHTDLNTNISWITDNIWFADTTNCQKINRTPSNYSINDKTRVFNIDNWSKRCYTLETTKGDDYLIRGTFLNYGDKSLNTSFLALVGVTNIGQVNSVIEDFEVESIFRATKEYIDFCVVKREGDPYISQLVLRTLKGLDYLSNSSSSVLKLVTRVNLGAKEGDIIKFPDDPSDRIWIQEPISDPTSNVTEVFNAKILNYGGKVRAPLKVLQTALVNEERLEFVHVDIDTEVSLWRVILYFLELDSSVRSGQRLFDIVINSVTQLKSFDIWSNGSNYKEVTLDFEANGVVNLSLVKALGSDFGPICNAYEVFKVIPWAQETSLSDVEAILEFKRKLLENNQRNTIFESWSGDPCFPRPWQGLFCETYNHNVTFITKLNLSSMSLTGPIPPSIIKLTNLTALNLSHNSFIGQIPPFSPPSMLRSVDLRNNDLSGPLPATLAMLSHLQILYIGCNPIVNEDPSSYNILGSKLDTSSRPCISEIEEEGFSRKGIIIGSVAGGSLVLTLAIGLFIFCSYNRNLMPHFITFNAAKSPIRNLGKNKKAGGHIIFSLPITQEVVVKSITIESYTLANIEASTQNFKTLIGEGGFGSVYRGTLPDGQQVAVKVRSATSTQGTKEFRNELDLLSTIFHENLVPLLGYCSENDQEILVYPFMSNGSLQDRLYGEASRRKRLDWPIRLSIALGAARGLTHLHNYEGRGVIHRDVKSSNILLDQSMTAKVADFGFSKYTPQEGESCASLEVRGTAGYLDPEYYTTHRLSDKSDVFSFGVVLLEIISGREPLNILRERNEWSLVEWAKQRARESNIDEIVDPSIKGGYHSEAMWRVVEVALTCVEPYSAYRPSMADVVRELEDALIIETNASEYMRSIDSSASMIFEKKIVLPPSTPTDGSPILTQDLPPPDPR